MTPEHVYVHVPFCARRCSYCDFAIAVRRIVPVDEYLNGIDREIDLRFGNRPGQVQSIYLGGGTPSRLGGEGIRRLVARLRDRFVPSAAAEITIEANPDDVTAEDAAAWMIAGVNRVSLGAQSFDSKSLQWMHRVHDVEAIPRAVETLRAVGLEDISIDLIFALPDSLARDWRVDLERAIDLGPTHVSLYGLTVETHAPLGRWVARGEAREAPEERYESEFLLADAKLTSAGFDHYEVSNFGRPGHWASHNFAYWRGVAYAGLGPGAHEFDGEARRWNTGNYVEWIRRLASGFDPVEGSEVLGPENRIAEQVYLGLRTVNGLEISQAEAHHVGRWVAAGWGRIEGSRLILSPAGWLRLDALSADLTLLRSH